MEKQESLKLSDFLGMADVKMVESKPELKEKYH